MGQSLYHIQQHSFDVSFFAADRARELQDKISRLFYNDLTEQIELLFDRLIPAELILQFDQLIINAGTVSFNRLDEDFVPAIIQALETEIKASLVARGIAENGTFPKSQSTKKTVNYLDATEYYLSHGILPWWVAGSALKDIGAIISHVLKENAELLKRLLLRLGRYNSVQKRLAQQFSWAIIKDLIRLLEPQNAEFIFQYHDYVLQTQQKKNIIKAELKQIGTVMWELIFKILLHDAVGRFNRKMFLKSNIIAIANYFNISYHYLLEMLNVAPYTGNFKATDMELVELLDELWKEESARGSKSMLYNDVNIEDTYIVINTTENLKTIQYYLYHGSMPASMPVKDGIMLNELMLELITKVPDSIKQIIRSSSHANDIGGKISAAFDDQVITKIIRLLEPASADFIITYHFNVQKLNQQQQFVKTGYADFSKTIWALIINYLVVDRGSDFNRQKFLESNIRGIASHYNLNLHELVVTLKQAALMILNARQLPLFIAALDVLIDEQKINDEPARPGKKEKNVTRALYSKQQIKDVLLFWLKHGKMPWWYKYENDTLQNIFNYLIDNAYDDALEIVIYAGTTTEMQYRILSAIPNYLLKVFEKLPGHKYSVEVFNTWYTLLNTSSLVNLKHDKALLKVTLNLFWKSLADRSYGQFDLIEFLENNIGEFSLWLGAETPYIFKSLFDVVQSDSRFNDFKAAIDTINSKSKLPGFTFDASVSYAMHDEWLKKVLSGYFGNGKTDKEAMIKNLYAILDHFLVYDKFPPGINVSPTQKAELLRVMMLTLFKSDPLLVKRLFLNRHNAAAAIYIHNLFTVTTTSEAERMQNFLNDFIYEDIKLFLKDTTTQSGSSLPEYVSQLVKRLLDNAITSHNYRPLLKLMQQESISALAAHHLTIRQIYGLIEDVNSGWGADTILFLQQIELFFLSQLPDYEKEPLLNIFKQFNLIYFAGALGNVSPDDYLHRLLRLYKNYFRKLTLIQLASLLRFNADSSGMSASFLKVLPYLKAFIQQQVERLNPNVIREKNVEPAQPGLVILPINESDVAVQLKKIAEQNPQLLSSPSAIDENESFHINNAGLVLLHPFLTAYFGRLNMLNNGKFSTHELQLRSVHLLQYLCDSTSNKPETDLLLNKILCGLPLLDPLPAEITLTDNEINVSAELLKAVTQRWEKLNNTSAESLQASFLQRAGTLTYTGGSWHLRVEPRSYDLLLQTLPWGLSMVKTSWMHSMLTIEWAQI